MDNKTWVFAGGVFAALFAGALFMPVDTIFKPLQPSVAVGPLKPTLTDTFQKVDESKDKRTPAQKAVDLERDEFERATMYAKINGDTPVSDDVLKAAKKDAPRDGYYKYGRLDRARITMRSWEGNHRLTGLKLACFSSQRDEEVVHDIVFYDGQRFEFQTSVDLYEWVYSGCADAVKAGPQLNRVQYFTTLRGLVPGTPKYETFRRDLLVQLNAKPDV
jgi:hypothetical protein